ncbi:hypothetical protein AVEN_270607-1 [Araneus ventricosus]|uniref:Uncharacterized protein n=1 Tax=Araneus ventricosus TaxID=182803 RepID=A0A4Y2DIW1_ARAVE|nr:hypothetical protein AVEN_270607-1 [Araneus ventricosus]
MCTKMAESNEDSKIILPFFPSLSHMALTKVAIELYNRVGIKSLLIFSSEIQFGNLTIIEKGSQEKCDEKYKRAKETILLIPTNLRERVFEVVQYIHDEVRTWKSDHSATFGLSDYFYLTFYWRCDGTINRTKTAQEIIWNEKIHIRKRFEIACIYCLVHDVTFLWAKLEAYAKLRIFKRSQNSVVLFWIRWLNNGALYSWDQYAQNYLSPPFMFTRLGSRIRFSSFFCELRPEHRQKFYRFLDLSDADDFRFCLYQATKKEQEVIMKMYPVKVLRCYLDWPLQSEFLEVAEKMWNYLKYSHFGLVLELLMAMMYRKDFDYKDLLIKFWHQSPNHFQEYARKANILNQQIDLFFSGRKDKRIADDYRSSKRFRS